mgnify:CR=1 FL=1
MGMRAWLGGPGGETRVVSFLTYYVPGGGKSLGRGVAAQTRCTGFMRPTCYRPRLSKRGRGGE